MNKLKMIWVEYSSRGEGWNICFEWESGKKDQVDLYDITQQDVSRALREVVTLINNAQGD